MSKAGSSLKVIVFELLRGAVIEVSLIGIGAKDSLKIFSDPFKEVAVISTELPVKDDVAIKAFVEPKVAGGAATWSLFVQRGL